LSDQTPNPENTNWDLSFTCLFLQSGKSAFLNKPESKEQRVENSDFLFLGQTVRADIFGRLFLGSQKSSQMAPYVVKSKNEESFVDINNILSKKYLISMFDFTKFLKTIMFTYLFKDLV
jgi:hypothetical protein